MLCVLQLNFGYIRQVYRVFDVSILHYFPKQISHVMEIEWIANEVISNWTGEVALVLAFLGYTSRTTTTHFSM